MPKSYDLSQTPPNVSRRMDLAQSDQWVRDYLAQAQVGHVATLWGEQPFITPSSFWYDLERNEIYFHSNIVGRVRANVEKSSRGCFEASDFGRLLPSNVALEFSIQYQSVIVYGQIRVVEDLDEKRRILYGLIAKYFPHMQPGQAYRPITENELKHTSVYALAIESWSGKRNWPDHAEQSSDWRPVEGDLQPARLKDPQ